MSVPRYDATGEYRLKTTHDKLVACQAALRAIVTCETAYHGQGPNVVVRNMAHTATSLLTRLRDLEKRISK